MNPASPHRARMIDAVAIVLASVFAASVCLAVHSGYLAAWLAALGLVAFVGALLLLPLVARQGLAWAYALLALLLLPPAALWAWLAYQPLPAQSMADATRLSVNLGVPNRLAAFERDTGRYPTTAEGLDALLHCPKGLEARWHGPYLEDEKILIDPWGEPYQYRGPGLHHPDSYDLWSGGARAIGNW